MADVEVVKPEGQQQMNKYWFNVKMTCSGCSGAVTRVLQRLKDDPQGKVTDFEVKLETQEVYVTGGIAYDELHEKIAKTGKQVIAGKTLDPEDEAAPPPVEESKTEKSEMAEVGSGTMQ